MDRIRRSLLGAPRQLRSPLTASWAAGIDAHNIGLRDPTGILASASLLAANLQPAAARMDREDIASRAAGEPERDAAITRRWMRGNLRVPRHEMHYVPYVDIFGERETRQANHTSQD